MDIEEWIDNNYSDLLSDYADQRPDEWHCEEDLQNLAETQGFYDYCEERFYEAYDK